MSKTVLVTGANGDIGKAIVRRLLKDGAYNVIGLCGDEQGIEDLQKMFGDAGQEASIHIVDFSDISKTKLFFDDQLPVLTSELFALINNAGIYPIQRFQDYTLELWEKVMNINLTAPFLAMKGCERLLSAGGRIVNVSSTGAFVGSRDPGYCASKNGIIGLTKAAARNFSAKGIAVTAVAPGMIDTQMSRRMKEEDRQKNLASSLIQRPGVPDDVAGVVSFLLSQDSSYMTGCTIDVNGGLYLR